MSQADSARPFAVDIFITGKYNCAQSVLLGLREEGTLDVPEELVHAATSFGGGVGLSKNICGCLTAAAMAVGLKFGNLKPVGTAPRPAYARSKAVLDQFRARFGSTQCGDLTAPWVNDFANSARVYRCAELLGFTLEQLSRVLQAEEELPDWQEPWWQDYLQRRDKVR